MVVVAGMDGWLELQTIGIADGPYTPHSASDAAELGREREREQDEAEPATITLFLGAT